MDQSFENLSNDLENLENNLITVINDLKASTEIILKELTGYLNVSAHDLSEIRSSVIKVETVLDTLKDYIAKLDTLEKELNSIKPSLAQTENNIINSMNDRFTANSSNMKKVASYLVSIQKQIHAKDAENDKRLSKIEGQVRSVSTSFRDTKDELIKSQVNLKIISMIHKLLILLKRFVLKLIKVVIYLNYY